MTFSIINAEPNYVTGLTHMTGALAAPSSPATPSPPMSAAAASDRSAGEPRPRRHPRSEQPPSEITAHIDGSMTDILKLTDMKPLNYATRFGLDPDSTMGKAGVDLDFHVPMRRNPERRRHRYFHQGGGQRFRHNAGQESARLAEAAWSLSTSTTPTCMPAARSAWRHRASPSIGSRISAPPAPSPPRSASRARWTSRPAKCAGLQASATISTGRSASAARSPVIAVS